MNRLLHILIIYGLLFLYTFAFAAVEPTPVRIVSSTTLSVSGTDLILSQLRLQYPPIQTTASQTILTNIFLQSNGVNAVSASAINHQDMLDLTASVSAVNISTVSNTASTSQAIGVLNTNITDLFSTNHLDLLNILSSVSGTNLRLDNSNTIAASNGTNAVSASAINHADLLFLSSGVSGVSTRLDTLDTTLTNNTDSTSAAIYVLNANVSSAAATTHSDFLNVIFSMDTNTNATVSGVASIITSMDGGNNRVQLVTSAGVTYQFRGATSTTALPIQITGGDGLYQANVDSVGRLAVNANVTFPETFYVKNPLASGAVLNMNTATNSGFIYAPASGTTYYLEELSCTAADNAAWAVGGFTGIAGLTNGITFGVQSKGTSFTLATVRTNEDFYNLFTQDKYYYSYSPGALQANVETVAGSWRLQNRIALDGNFGDKVEVRVRDNLSTLVGMRCSASLWRTNP